MLRKIAVNFCLLLLALIVALSLVEVFLRFFKPEYGHAAKSAKQASASTIMRNPSSHHYYSNHPVDNSEYLIIHNRLGLRQHREFSDAKPPQVLRIGFFGDSFTENLRMEAQYSFTEPLDYLLNSTGIRFQVLNFGVDGFGTEQVFVEIMNKASRLELDMVFYIFCSNDLKNNCQTDLLEVDAAGQVVFKPPARSNPLKRLISELYITYLFIDVLNEYHIRRYRKVLAHDKINEVMQSLKADLRGEECEGTRLDFIGGIASARAKKATDYFTRLLTALKGHLTNKGIAFRIVLLPREPEEKMARYLAGSGLHYLSMLPEFQRHYKTREYLFPDGHWNEEGNKLAAILLFNQIIREIAPDKAFGPDYIAGKLSEYYGSFSSPRVSGRFLDPQTTPDAATKSSIQRRYLELTPDSFR